MKLQLIKILLSHRSGKLYIFTGQGKVASQTQKSNRRLEEIYE
jgi:hypothetical protein